MMLDCFFAGNAFGSKVSIVGGLSSTGLDYIANPAAHGRLEGHGYWKLLCDAGGGHRDVSRRISMASHPLLGGGGITADAK